MTYPTLLTLNEFGGDWSAYIEAVYDRYLTMVVRQNLTFRGKRISFKHVPATDGKGAAFWHAVQEAGETNAEEDRMIDLRRCERIAWPAYMLRNALEDGSQGPVFWWETVRNGRKRVVLWLRDDDYALILEDRGDYYLFWTTYLVRGGRRRKFEAENAAFWRR